MSETYDWEAQLALADTTMTKDQIKEQLPLQYVLMRYGADFEDRGGALTTNCPNTRHDDENPSFNIYRTEGDNFDRCGCFSCELGGDLFDVIQFLDDAPTFPEAMRIAEAFLGDFVTDDEDWVAITVNVNAKIKAGDHRLEDTVTAAHYEAVNDPTYVDEFLAFKGIGLGHGHIDHDWLIREFKLGTRPERHYVPEDFEDEYAGGLTGRHFLIAPLYNDAGAVESYKKRLSTGAPQSQRRRGWHCKRAHTSRRSTAHGA